MKSSFGFLVAQGFLSICVMIAIFTLPMPLAWVGHTVTHFMHEMHLSASTFLGALMSMAPTGHSLAHRPHLLHPLWAVGCAPFIGSLYGRFPGI